MMSIILPKDTKLVVTKELIDHRDLVVYNMMNDPERGRYREEWKIIENETPGEIMEYALEQQGAIRNPKADHFDSTDPDTFIWDCYWHGERMEIKFRDLLQTLREARKEERFPYYAYFEEQVKTFRKYLTDDFHWCRPNLLLVGSIHPKPSMWRYIKVGKELEISWMLLCETTNFRKYEALYPERGKPETEWFYDHIAAKEDGLVVEWLSRDWTHRGFERLHYHENKLRSQQEERYNV